jgi:ABC-type sugar transport system permease subunit
VAKIDSKGQLDCSPARIKGARGLIPILPLVFLILVVGVLPFFTALGNSFFSDIWGEERRWTGLTNYISLFEDRAFLISLGITLAWAILSTLITLSLGFVVACALLSAKKGYKALYLALLVPWGIPSFISVPLWRMIVHGNGGRSILSALTGIETNLLTNPMAGFISALAVDVWLGIPLIAFATYAALGAQDRCATEAAKIDGAGSWTIARWIWAPQARTTLLILGALDFVKSFKEFSVPFLMTAGGPPFLAGITRKNIVGATTTLEIFLYDAFRAQNDLGVPSAYSVVVGVLVLALVSLWFFLRKRIGLREKRIKPGYFGIGAEIPWKIATGIVPALCVLSALAVIYAVLWLSFSSLSAVYIDSAIPRFISSTSYRSIIRDESIFRYFFNTFIVSALTAILIPVVILPAAWKLTRVQPSRSVKMLAFIEAMGMTGGIHSLIPLFIVFRVVGLLGGFTPVVTVYLFHALPLSLFTIKALLDRIPPSFEEAAKMEGMPVAAYVLRIVVPLCLPAIVAAMMTSFISAWNGFLVPLVFLSDDRLYTIGIKLHSLVGSVASGNPKWNLFAAASVLNMIFVALFLWKFSDPLKRNLMSEAWQ